MSKFDWWKGSKVKTHWKLCNKGFSLSDSKDKRDLKIWVYCDPLDFPVHLGVKLNIFLLVFKGSVSVISSDPPCKDNTARLPTVPFESLSDDVWTEVDKYVFVSLNYLFSFVTCAFLAYEKQ